MNLMWWFFKNCEFLGLCLSVTSWLNCKTINRALTNHIVQLTVLRIKPEYCIKNILCVWNFIEKERTEKKSIMENFTLTFGEFFSFPFKHSLLLSSCSYIKQNFRLGDVNENIRRIMLRRKWCVLTDEIRKKSNNFLRCWHTLLSMVLKLTTVRSKCHK